MKKLWSNIIRFGMNNPEEFLFIEQFSSSPYITKLTREEVIKGYVFILDLMEDFKKECSGHASIELFLMIFYQSTRAVVSFILDSDTLAGCRINHRRGISAPLERSGKLIIIFTDM
ncbi:MAG: hypothetical protein PHF18_14885 [Methanosarcina sp.]|uniref:hypothetical protein n=1 Tax=Methanosarcina sp. TaxID=2213 RepID=UPI00261D4115|nr:hypothetical protein [Methanosarcina sp.]MDD3248115.1 hypothetical protein [Methanosarcina sp.]MDD4248056.1 hypothetical protein [Methanosarcina sp.]